MKYANTTKPPQTIEPLVEISYSEQFDFEATSAYSSKNNYSIAQMCNLVYQEKDFIENQIKKWRQNGAKKLKVEITDMDSFRYMIVSSERFILLIFRGTINYQNWLTDFNMSQISFEHGKGLVHRGFYESILKMKNDINASIGNHSNNNQLIYIAGHSLGGAQATLAAFVCEKLSLFTSITTFGAPRIGNQEMVRELNGRLNHNLRYNKSGIFRVVNAWDPVPMVPYFYYYHEGDFYLFSSGTNEHYTLEKTDELPNLPNEQWQTSIQAERDMIFNNLNYHSMVKYLENADFNQKENPF